jgi:hypothetical protein
MLVGIGASHPPNLVELAAPSVKQRLAALRHLFDWLVTISIYVTGRVVVARYSGKPTYFLPKVTYLKRNGSTEPR